MSNTDIYALFEQARQKSVNPFSLIPVISENEVWGDGDVVIHDLPGLNQHIDERIFDAITEVRQKYSPKIGIAIKGDRGTGKSHIIHRLWKKITQEGGSVFAYIGPYANPKRINSHVRFYLADSFTHQDSQGITQWQKLAAAAINTLKGSEFEDKYRSYIEKCNSPDELRKYIVASQSKATLSGFFDELVEAILENQTGIDFNFLRAILFLLLKNVKDAQIALAWIKGEDHSEIETIGLPEFSLDIQEDKSIWMMEQICKLAEIASLPVVICFDQLDSAGTDNDSGDSPAQSIAKCIDRIYFRCSNVILICCVISDTWIQIEQMGSGIPDRVGQRSVRAKPPTTEQTIELVKLRLDLFYKKNNLNSEDYPHLYPFEESKIRHIASESAGARSLMIWCADEFEKVGTKGNDSVDPPPPPDKKKQFLETYQKLVKRIRIPMKDDDQLAAIIFCAMTMIPNGGTENVVIQEVKKIADATHDLHFIISGYDCLHKSQVKIGVRICETTNGKTFNAVMTRLVNYDKYGLTRGCLIRSTDVPRSWKIGYALKEKLEKEQGGEVVVLKKNDMKPLVAIQKIYEQSEDYGFTKEEIKQFVKDLGLAADNLLICEILSAPV
jgi:Cdc6-like AAA superfamily ATPase